MDNFLKYSIADQYTKTPGGRKGDYSGEDFRIKVLHGLYLKAKKENKKLIIDLDGGYGYGSSFLEEAFGGLVRQLKKEKNKTYKEMNKIIKIISNQEPALIEDIREYINEEINRK